MCVCVCSGQGSAALYRQEPHCRKYNDLKDSEFGGNAHSQVSRAGDRPDFLQDSDWSIC